MTIDDDAIRVLCVDDDPAMAELVAESLAAADERVEATVETDPAAALSVVDGTVDCVVSDYRMPSMDGLELLAAVRASHPDLPFVLFTGQGSERVAAEAIAAGVTHYVPKRAGEGDGPAVAAERAIDAVERRRTRERLERARETQRALIEAAPVPMWVQGVAEIYFANDAAAEFFGADSSADLVGRSALDHVPGADREAVREKNRRMMVDDGSADALEGYTRGVDGVERYGLYAGAAIRFEGRDALLVVARDITSRVEREESLRERNERLQEFASVVSHDVRTPLSTASGHVDAALSALRDGDDPDLGFVESCLETAADANRRMDAITADLLELARQGRTVDDPERVLLSDLVADARADAGNGTTVRVDADGRLVADPSRTTELLSNLFVNARDHGGADEIRVGGLPGANGVLEGFYVEDDGSGVPPDDRERVFESGYSTADRGTGFGLAIVDRIADAHGWDVDLVAAVDGGARFEFRRADAGGGAEAG